jgi:predicted phosphodiesterase
MILGFISDIHEDIRNLEKAFRLLDALMVDEIICLGDMVGFNVESCNFLHERDASACIDLVKTRCCKVIPGNHDLYALRKIPEHRGGFNYENGWYDLDFKIRKEKGDGKIWLYEETELSALLSDSEKSYLDSLHETENLKTDHLNLLFTHYIYPNITGSSVGFVENAGDCQEHLQFLNSNKFDFSFSGHGHIQGLTIASEEKYQIVNFNQKIKIDPGSAVTGPCISRGSKRNGVMVFNTLSREIEAIPLG